MPAIQPVLLKQKIDDLFQHYDSPATFVRALKDLLDFYADRTKRPGGKGAMVPLIRSYRVPRQVLRHIEKSLEVHIQEMPHKGVMLADVMWDEPWLECRVLAFEILGWIPPGLTAILRDRLEQWCNKCGFDPVMDASLARAMTRLWKNSPDLVMGMLETWLTSTQKASKKWGLRVANALVDEPGFNNLPIIFRLLAPHTQTATAAPDSDLLIVIRSLAKRAPEETAYFLRRCLTRSENPAIFTLIRQSLDMYASPTRQELRTFLHERRAQNEG